MSELICPDCGGDSIAYKCLYCGQEWDALQREDELHLKWSHEHDERIRLEERLKIALAAAELWRDIYDKKEE